MPFEGQKLILEAINHVIHFTSQGFLMSTKQSMLKKKVAFQLNDVGTLVYIQYKVRDRRK